MQHSEEKGDLEPMKEEQSGATILKAIWREMTPKVRQCSCVHSSRTQSSFGDGRDCLCTDVYETMAAH